ncbi:MAG: gliding motility-associated C-terminal domain-containing protein [Bacteroidota bacterium]
MYRILVFFIAFLWSTLCQGQYRFIENKGQWNDNVQFKADIPGGSFYLEKGRFTFDRYDTETVSRVFAAHSGLEPIPTPEKLKCHAYNMTFVNSLSHDLKGKKAFETLYAYYLRGRVGENARGFKEVIYENLYEGIDLKVHSKGNLKYDFIVKAGTDPTQIEIEYEGVKPKLKSDGRIELNTSLGKIEESEPFAYQIINGLITRVDCKYILHGQSVKFELGEYNREKQLIIDPELIFSTYSGSLADNFGYTATFDIEGHLYSGSSVFGNGYPISLGAYQTDWAGGGNGANGGSGTDIGISKFSLDGTSLIYSTYLGGSGNELPHSLVTDSLGRLYVLGTTGSDNYPTSEDAFQTFFNGGTTLNLGTLGINYLNGSDMIVSVLSETGQDLISSTYLGGSANDGLNTAAELRYNYADEVRGEIELDNFGNVLIGSSTFSDDFPITENAIQQSIGGGQDGVFTVLRNDLTSIIASSFIGGSEDDAVFAFSYSGDIGVTLGGGTNSSNFPIPSNAYISSFSGGDADGYVLTISGVANSIISGTYLGTSTYDQIYFADRDSDGNVYVLGQTESTEGQLFFNANYGEPGQGMFITKFSPDLESADFSTTFGVQQGVPAISPVAFAVDLCNRIYLSGWGGNTNDNGNTFGLDVTEDAFQSTTDGSDFYFMVLEDDANALTFASYYGGNISAEHVDGGTSRFDRTGKIYQAVCAGCGNNNDFPIEPANALSPLNNSNNCNLGVAKIDFDLPLSLANFQAENECLPNAVFFENTSDLFTESEATFTWFLEGELLSTADEFEFLFDSPGEYTIQLVLNDPLACNLTDQITKSVTVFPELIIELPDTIVSCDQNTFTIEAVTNGTANSFIWAEDEDLSNIIQEGPIDSTLTITVNEPTSIYLEVDNGLCTDLREVYLVPRVDVELSTDGELLCNTDTFEITLLTNYSEGFIEWSPDELIISGQGLDTALVNTSSSLDIEVSVSNAFGCSSLESASLSSYDIDLNVPMDTLACLNDPVTLIAESNNAQTFEWSSSPTFDPLLNENGENFITVTPSSTQEFFIRVQNNGCILIDTVVVSLLEASTTLSGLQYICQGDTALLFVTNDFPGSQLTHSWEPSELIISGNGTSSIQAIIDEPTTFTVVSSTDFGCTVENSITVFTSALGGEEVNASAEPRFIVSGESSQLSILPSNDDYSYQWNPPTYLDNPNITDPESTPEESIEYIVTILDVNDLGFCQKTDSVIIQVFDSFCGYPNIFVPNAFTPNGDGENDEVLVRGRNITDLTFTIFNRWGEEVFKTENQSEGWDGTYKGNLAEPAVFVYQLEAVCEDGETYFDKGNITLIR